MKVKNSNQLPYLQVKAGDEARMQVLVEGPNFVMRRFVMGPGGGMPEHTNTVEHEQYVLAGRAEIGIGGETFSVRAGDVVFIPEGVPHWYRNTGEGDFEFLCVVPNLPDNVELIVKAC